MGNKLIVVAWILAIALIIASYVLGQSLIEAAGELGSKINAGLQSI